MDIWSKKLLMSNPSVKYTLTVTTDPVSATCTLTADGVSSSTKTLTVDAGTVISYSVYHATYGTTTGTITMNSDKTLNCVGTYDETTVEQAWSNPIMTSDQTPGGSVFAAFADSSYSTRLPYKIFDGQSATVGYIWQSVGSLPHYIGFYNPTPIRITSLTFNWYRAASGYYSPLTANIQASNDGTTYTTLQTITNSTNPSSTTLTNYSSVGYKYYRVYGTDGSVANTYACAECSASGYTQVSSYTYYWQTTIT